MSESLSGGTGRLEQHGSSPTVKDEARGVADETATSAKAVGGVAKNEAANVAHEARSQAKDLLSQSRDELMEQASHQQARAAEGLHALHRQLHSMASNSEEQGVGTDLVRQAAGRTEAFADWLDHRDPGSVIEEVKRYAGRRPGLFLAIAAGAGLLAGRLSRSLGATAKDGTANDDAHGAVPPRPATPPTSAAYTADAGYVDSGYAAESGYTADAGNTVGAGYTPAPTSPNGTSPVDEGTGYVTPAPTSPNGTGLVDEGAGLREATPRGGSTGDSSEETNLDGLFRTDQGDYEQRPSDGAAGLTGRRVAPPVGEHPEEHR